MAGTSLETLPAELLLEIGAHLDKPSSLASLMFLNSRFYTLVTLNQAKLITETLNNLITPELLPQAIAVFEASKVESWTPEKTKLIVSQFNGGKYVERVNLSVKDGLNIQRRHEKIMPFMTDFVQLALPLHPKLLVEPKPLSQNENLRVKRAFYRFELCANIFQQHIVDENSACDRCEHCKELTKSSVSHVILFLFPHTDLEQMVTIAEFIQDRNHRYGKKWEWDLTPAWMAPESSKEWAKRVVSFFSNPILESSSSTHNHQTLDFERTHYNKPVEVPLVKRYGGSIPPDTDKGPKNAFRWARKYMKRPNLDNLITLEHRRSWGYALWDEQRLRDEWGLVGSVVVKR